MMNQFEVNEFLTKPYAEADKHILKQVFVLEINPIQMKFLRKHRQVQAIKAIMFSNYGWMQKL